MAQNNVWARINGQAELRANLRAALKAARLTQAAAATEAGVKYTHLVGGLNGNNWLTEAAVIQIAVVLDVEPQELVGGSIFKGQRDRYPDFDYLPPEYERLNQPPPSPVPVAEARATGTRTRALCCECGALRTCSTRGLYPYNESEEYGFQGRPGRFVVTMKCTVCDAQTRHAVMRVDENRDCAEQWDHAPTNSDLARQELQALINRLHGFGVEIHYRTRNEKSRAKGYAAGYSYDQSKSCWRIELDPNAPYRIQHELLSRSWNDIARDDFGDISWDPRETGTIMTPGDSAWQETTTELLEDVTRFLSVERRRLIQHVEDRVAATAQSDDADDYRGAQA